MGWLKSRLAVLIEICTESDAQRQAAALSKLSTDFKGLLTSLSEVRPTTETSCYMSEVDSQESE